MAHCCRGLIAILCRCSLLLIAALCRRFHCQIKLLGFDHIHVIFISAIKGGLGGNQSGELVPAAWPSPRWLQHTRLNAESQSVILCRQPALMRPPAADDNGMSGPYWTVSCYRCVIPSCRSPPGWSSCLHLLITPHRPTPHPRDGGAECQPS